MAVEVGAYLVPVEPGLPDVGEGRLDVVVAEVADVGGAGGVVRREVLALLRLGEEVDPGEEEGHVGAVCLRQLQEAREEAVAHLSRPVPGEDHELRRGLARLQRHRLVRLVGLLAGVRGGAVPDGLGGGAGLGRRLAGRPVPVGTLGALVPLRIASQDGPAAGRTESGGGPEAEAERTTPAEATDAVAVLAVHGIPIRRTRWCSPIQRARRTGRFPMVFWASEQLQQPCH